jgi:PKHD-type hydroxylase
VTDPNDHVIYPIPRVDTGIKMSLRRKLFNKRECRKIIWLGREMGTKRRWSESVGEHEVEVTQYFLPSDHGESSWVFERLTQLVLAFNKHHRYALTGFMEPLRLMEYAEGDFNDWHVDHEPNDTSKYAIIVQLNDPSEYKGGQLGLLNFSNPTLAQGEGVIFHAWHAHQVKEVTEGTRYSLAAWVAGPRFV